MLFIYRSLTFFLYPLFVLIIFLRIFLKKEDKVRFKEKIFSSTFNYKRDFNKKLIWFHASSIGELLSIVSLIKNINNENKNIEFLVTTATLSSANLFEKNLSGCSNIIHRFFPLDVRFLVDSFLNTWRPDLVCFIDSEIWPNFLFNINERKIPLILLNARITKKTLNKWKIFPKFAKKVFGNFDLCLSSSEESRNNLKKLGVKKANYLGNLKFSSKINTSKLSDTNKLILNNFKVWCAASTHEGEEEMLIKSHVILKQKITNIKTIIIPRHINRVSNIKNLTKKYKLKAQIISGEEKIDNQSEIVIVNSFGVLSRYYEYCKIIFIGKSLLKKFNLVGGQNPIEPAKFGCKIFHGPYVYNFNEVYSLLKAYKISIQVNDEKELSEKLLESFKKLNDSTINHSNKLDIYGDKILKETIKKLKNYINLN
tara:strand:- start:132 stop:1409 length:1278 start_codon:yes stop_codon:yes gene_type:complete